MAVTINNRGYERRLALVKDILQCQGLQSTTISTLAYDEKYEYPFNNFLFKVELAAPATYVSFPGTQPGTTRPPSDGVSTLVIKLSNLAAEGLNNVNRVQNDVAAQHLVRQSIAQAGLEPFVPAVYAWAPATTTDATDEKDFGWIISEFRSGVDLHSHFSSLEHDKKEQVLKQFAAVLRAIQTARLPASVTKFSGLKFDSMGQITNGEAAMKGEPVDSYAELWGLKLRKQLDQANKSPVIQGWKRNGLNTRIKKFLASGGPETLLSGVDVNRKNLIHGDFTMNNILVDKDTDKITAVLDFDWSYICNPFHEFMSSLSDVGGNITLKDNKFEEAILSGDYTMQPDGLDEESSKKWELSKAWNAAMKKGGVIAPSDIKGVDKIRDLALLQNLLCPFQFVNESSFEQIGDDKKAELRAKTEADLVKWLEKYGY